MFIIVDYSYRNNKILYIVIRIEDINKLRNFLFKNNLPIAHIKDLEKIEKRSLLNKWKKFLYNKDNLEELKNIIKYKFFKNLYEIYGYIDKFDNEYNIFILDDTIIYKPKKAILYKEGDIPKIKKEFKILIELADTLLYLKQNNLF